MLAVVLTMALLLAPVAALPAMPCHDHAGHAAVPAGLTMTAGDLGHARGGSHEADHRACCASPCSTCIVGAELSSAALALCAAAPQRYLRTNQLGTGLALPPALAPPRLAA